MSINQEWEKEKESKRFTHKGYPCKIRRHEEMGHLCGYVGVPKSHILYGLSYGMKSRLLKKAMERVMNKPTDMDTVGVGLLLNAMIGNIHPTLENVVEVHGGVTFADFQRNSKLWWIGFDCNHCNDLAPYMEDYSLGAIAKHLKVEIDSSFLGEMDRMANKMRRGKTYKNMDYVSEECRKLAEQFKEISEETPKLYSLLAYPINWNRALKRATNRKMRPFKIWRLSRSLKKWKKKWESMTNTKMEEE